MSKRTREGKNAKSQQPAKPGAISIRRKFAQPYGKTRLLKEILDTHDPTNPDPMLEKRLVDTSRDFERYVHEGLQKDASQ